MKHFISIPTLNFISIPTFHFISVPALIGLSLMLSSCSEKAVNQYFYQWGVTTLSTQYSGFSDDNLLYQETIQGILDFEKKYNGTGVFTSDATAYEKTNYDEALIAYDALEASINERIKTVDNYGLSFKVETKYYFTKDNSTLKNDVFKTFEYKGDENSVRFNGYTTVTEIPLTEELQKNDPASYPVTINLETAGICFDDITEIQYDDVKVYDSSTRVINTEQSFISGGSASLDKRTLTLTFTGTNSALEKMKGDWYAQVYLTATADITATLIVKVPFTVK